MNTINNLNATHGKTWEEPDIQAHPGVDSIWVIPLGGLGEIGKNMMVIESSDDIIIIDAGIMFPTEEMPGIDYVIPDIRYLLYRKNKIRGIILTHGHEDHIGALPYFLEKLEAPVYGNRLTLELLRCKFREFNLLRDELLLCAEPDDEITLGSFTIRFFRVIHSISESMGLLIGTPAGKVIHSGDFKFDTSPVDGKVADFFSLARIDEGNIRLLMSDSTYAERPGFSLPEKAVGKTLETVFSRCTGRIIISTFASSIPRIQQIIAIARNHGRRLCVLGRGLESTMSIARELGYIEYPPEMIVRPEDMKDFPDPTLLVLATGSQGEPLSALTLMASNNHKWVKIKKNDTVIISATPVPGNETLVNNTINSLFRLGAEVIYQVPQNYALDETEAFHIHASGHGSIEELKLLIDMVKPEFFMPIHGETRHLVHHARLAREMGLPDDRILLIEDGTMIEFSPGGAKSIGKLSLEHVFIDGLGVGDIGRVVLKDRHIMSQDGICIVVAVIDGETRDIFTGPHVETRGLIYVPESQEMLDEATELVRQFLRNNRKERDLEVLKSSTRSLLRRFFHSRIKRKPIVVPMIIEL